MFYTDSKPSLLDDIQKAKAGNHLLTGIVLHTAIVFIRTVKSSGEWQAKIITEIAPFKEFYRAEEYHQKYPKKNPRGYT